MSPYDNQQLRDWADSERRERRETLIRQIVACLLLGFAAGVAWEFCGYLIHKDENTWIEFRDAHACHIVGRAEGQTHVFNTIGTNGKVGIGISTDTIQTGWLCADGITYWNSHNE